MIYFDFNVTKYINLLKKEEIFIDLYVFMSRKSETQNRNTVGNIHAVMTSQNPI